MYVLIEYFRVPDCPEDLEVEDGTVLGLFDNSADAERAGALMRQAKIDGRKEDGYPDETKEEIEEEIDTEYRYEVKKMEPNPSFLLHEYGSTPLR